MSSLKKFRLPCGKRHFNSPEEAHADLTELIIRKSLAVVTLVVYKCQDCSHIEQKDVWHYGNVGKNGKVRIRLPNGGNKKYKIGQLIEMGQSKVFR